MLPANVSFLCQISLSLDQSLLRWWVCRLVVCVLVLSNRQCIWALWRIVESIGVASWWASPVVLVPKKDWSLYICVNYRWLNVPWLKRMCIPSLPHVDAIVDTLGDAKYFTTWDLESGYWQVKLDDNVRPKIAFTTQQGLVRMLFRLTCQQRSRGPHRQ